MFTASRSLKEKREKSSNLKILEEEKKEKIVLKASVRISNEAISWLDALTSLTACVEQGPAGSKFTRR